MENRSLKVHIAADNALVVNGLRHILEGKFGSRLSLSGSYDLRTFMRNIDPATDVAIIDYFFDGVSGEELRRKIMAVNGQVKVIYHSSHQDVITTIDRIMQGETAAFEKKYSHKLENQYL